MVKMVFQWAWPQPKSRHEWSGGDGGDGRAVRRSVGFGRLLNLANPQVELEGLIGRSNPELVTKKIATLV